jgi:hypothetical protein
MKHVTSLGRSFSGGWRISAALFFAVCVAACGQSSDPGSGDATGVLEGIQDVVAGDGSSSGGGAGRDPGTSEGPAQPVPADGVVTDPDPTAEPTLPAPGPVVTPAFSWTKPAGFDAALAAAIESQPSYMDGYGGTVANPFPQLPGTAKFPSMQLTRADAIQLGDWFGRPSFRFYVDADSRHSNGLRAEFTDGAQRFVAGDTFNYQFSSYFPSEYRNSSWTEWNLFAQFHGPGFPAWGLHTAGGYLHMIAPEADRQVFRAPMPSRDVWHDFDWTIHWTPDSSGWATLRIDGVLVFDYRGATMHAGEPYYYPKFGSYLANNPYSQVTYSTPWVITRR